jgi:CHAD domain-containing protein
MERKSQGPVSARLRLVAVKGHARESRDIARLLERDLGLDDHPPPLLVEAVAASGRHPGDYSTKLDYRLDPGQRANMATKEILLGLLATLEANVAGARANLDTEFLHDLRVATRRTRSALTQIKGVFPEKLVEGYKQDFAWLQQITGPVRDLDVYLLEFDAYQGSLPLALQPHLEPLRDYVLAHYEEEQRKVAGVLGSERFQHLLKEWRAFLEAPVPGDSYAPNAARPIKEVADERIWRLYKRVLKEARAITPDSPAEDLHELRKSCKKLRYLLEFFSSLYPKRRVRTPIKILKTLLGELGRFQDLAVQAEKLRAIAQAMRDEGRAETDTLLALGVLVGDLLRRQQSARDAIAPNRAAFSGKENRRSFERLFAPIERRKGGEAERARVS